MSRIALIACVLINLCKNVENAGYVPYETLFEGPKGSIFYKTETSYLTLSCNEHTSLIEAFERPFNKTLSAQSVSLFACRPPSTTYIEYFKTMNINTTAINNLYLYFNETEILPPSNYTEGLTIQYLNLVSRKRVNVRNIFDYNENFLEPLSNLTVLMISKLQMPRLPSTAHVDKISLSDGATVSEWGNCVYVKSIYIFKIGANNFPTWPANCSQLTDLSISSILPQSVQVITSKLSPGVVNLRVLSITNCRLYTVPYEIIDAAPNLTEIDLSDNFLYDTSFVKFPVLKALTSLDVNSNKLTGSSLIWLVKRLPALKNLYLGHNENFHKNCDDDEGEASNNPIVVLQETSIEMLSLGGIRLKESCFSNMFFSNLQNLKVDLTDTETLEFANLPKTNASDLTIDFGYINFEEIFFDEQDYEELRQRNISSMDGNNQTHLTLLIRYISCDCQHSWVKRALQDFPNLLTIPGLKCDREYGTPILEEPPQNMECAKWDDGNCTYRKSWQDGRVVGVCESEQLGALATPLHGLNMSHSGIDTLRPDLPDTLQWVDLRHNRITGAEVETAAALFAGGRRVWLGDNLLDCDCHNALLAELLRHQDQVEDFDSLTCAGSGQPLSSVSMAELCQVPLQASLATAAVLIALAVAIVLVVRRYGQAIRMYLYARGVCLPCIRKQELEDRLYEYDAFLSFAHGDETFVREQLLPGLERAGFRVCVHYRDWVVGDWIPAQIMRSVHRARRTIIVLSRHFVRSTWSSLEFRYAVAHAAQAGGLRLLVLVLDDVLDDPLDAELQEYLALNTYVRCDDPYFWDKLRYAMPHYPTAYSQPKHKDTPLEEAPSRSLHSGVPLNTFVELNTL